MDALFVLSAEAARVGNTIEKVPSISDAVLFCCYIELCMCTVYVYANIMLSSSI